MQASIFEGTLTLELFEVVVEAFDRSRDFALSFEHGYLTLQ